MDRIYWMDEQMDRQMERKIKQQLYAASLGGRILEIDVYSKPGLEVIKLEFILRLKIKRSDWLLADTCPQTANHCALF